MPIISVFYGITIRIYFRQGEHNPPHIHAVYGEHVAAVSIQTGTILDGYLPPKAFAMVKEWSQKHRSALMEMWETQNFYRLPPLE